MPLLKVSIRAHERPSLMKVEVVNMIDVCDYCYFVLHVVLVEIGAVSVYHTIRNLLLLVKLPAIERLLQLVRIEAIFNIFLLHAEQLVLRVFIAAAITVRPRRSAFFPPLYFLLLSFLFVCILHVLLTLLFPLLHVLEFPLHIVIVILVTMVRRERHCLLCSWQVDIIELRAHQELQLPQLLRTHFI